MPEEIPSAEHSAAGIVDTIHRIAEGHATMQGSLGKVVAPPPNIDILWNGIHLTREQVYLNEQWLIGHRREARGHIVSATQDKGGGGGFALFESHNHAIDNSYTESFIYTDTLKPGDWVTVFPVEMEGEQLYMVTEKMVKL